MTNATTETSVSAPLSESNIADDPLLWSLKTAAEKLSITYWQMHEYVKDGTIASVYQGRRRYVTPAAVRAFVAGLPTEAPDDASSA